MDKSVWKRAFEKLPEYTSPEDLGPLARYLGPLARPWREAVRRQQMQSDLLLTSYWSLRLMLAMDERRDHLEIPGFRFTAYGFISTEQGEPDFGVQHYAGLAEEEKVTPPEPITVDMRAFPVVIRRVKETLHAPAVHPQWGTAGCWGISRKGSHTPRGPGVVTAKHVITKNVGSSPRIGDQIDLSDRSKGTILDLGPDGIDAGLISTPEPAGNTRLSMMQPIVPWTNVTFEGAASRAHSTWVTQVTDVRGVISSLLPARAIIAGAGLGGDSGALVYDSNNDTRGIGFYIGELADPAGQSAGIVQDGHQVEKLMDMEFYL